jgi:DNA-binding transcriptional MerR regulator
LNYGSSQVLTITELARRTGLSASALRYYERKGLLRSSGRAGGKRTYDDRAIEQLAIVDLFQQSGMTIADIVRVLDPDGHIDHSWKDVARARLEEVETRLQELDRARAMLTHSLLCRASSLESCVTFRQSVATHAAGLAGRRRSESSLPT